MTLIRTVCPKLLNQSIDGLTARYKSKSKLELFGKCSELTSHDFRLQREVIVSEGTKSKIIITQMLRVRNEYNRTGVEHNACHISIERCEFTCTMQQRR